MLLKKREANAWIASGVGIHCNSKSSTLKSKAVSRVIYEKAGRSYSINCLLLYKTAVCKAVLMKTVKRLKICTSAVCVVYHIVSKFNKDFKNYMNKLTSRTLFFAF